MSGRTLAAIRREVRADWAAIVEASGVRSDALRALPTGPMSLLGSAVKTEKGEALLRVLTAVVYMAPDREAFETGDHRTLCPFSGDCAAACLGHSAGRMIMSTCERARLWKTALLLGRRRLWRELLDAEVESHRRRADRLRMVPAVRVDGSSDTGEGRLAAMRAEGRDDETTRFYDYTKSERRAAPETWSPNYSVVFSHSERSDWDTERDIMERGGSVAIVFDTPIGADLPRTYRGFDVVNGDETDVRFYDSPGVVVGLRFKAARDRERGLVLARNFVVRADAT